MPLRPLPYREIKRRLESIGFQEVSQQGSYVTFARETEQGLRTVIVPNHREVAAGTVRSILRQAGLIWEEFEGL